MKHQPHADAVDLEIKDANLKRLRRIEGQVRGLQKMIEEDRYCPDIITQIQAVRSSLASLQAVLLQGHLEHCVKSGYGIVIDGKFHKFDAEGNKQAEAIFRATKKTENLTVRVEGTLQHAGDITVTKLTEI